MPRIVRNEAPAGVPRWFAALVPVLFVILPGCMSNRAPRVDIQTPAGLAIRQRGDAQAPAAVSTSRAFSELPLPAGTPVQVQPDGKVNIVLTEPVTLRTESTADTATAAASFQPPSPSQLAQGFGVRLWGVVGVVLFVLAIVLAARGHVKAAGLAGFGAVLAPLVGHFVNSTAGMIVGAVAVAAAVTLFAAWHIMRRRGAIVGE